MPVIVADNWIALREGIDVDAEGNNFFTGKIVVTFWLDKKNIKYATGSVLETEVERSSAGTVIKKQKKEDGGKTVIKFYRVTYEHQMVVPRVNKGVGFAGWSFSLPSGEIICLAKGRGEMKKVLAEDPVKVAVSVAQSDGDNTNEPEDIRTAISAEVNAESSAVQAVDQKPAKDVKDEKPKYKMVRAQPDDLLNAVFLVK